MLVKVLIFALAVNAINCTIFGGYGTGLLGTGLSSYALGGIPAYRSVYGGSLLGANTFGLGGLGVARYGGLYGSGLYGSGVLGSGVLGYGAGLGLRGYGIGGVGLLGSGISAASAHPVNAAVQTLARTVDYRAVPNTGEPIIPQIVDVPPSEQPVQLNFHSKSSPLIVSQHHIPGEPGQVQVTSSEDEPQRVIHTVNKPVIQEVHETIQPYRQLTQEVNPVIEQANTLISQGEGARITGLASGVVGGSGILGASGIAHGVGLGAVGLGGLGVKTVGLGGLGVAGLGVGGVRTIGSGLYGAGLYGSGIYGAGVRPFGLGTLGGYGSVYGSGLYGSGLYGSGLYGSGLYGGSALIKRF